MKKNEKVKDLKKRVYLEKNRIKFNKNMIKGSGQVQYRRSLYISLTNRREKLYIFQ